MKRAIILYDLLLYERLFEIWTWKIIKKIKVTFKIFYENNIQSHLLSNENNV